MAFCLFVSALAATGGTSLTLHAPAGDQSWMTPSSLRCCSKMEAERHSSVLRALKGRKTHSAVTGGDAYFAIQSLPSDRSVSRRSKAELSHWLGPPMQTAPSQAEAKPALPAARNAPSEGVRSGLLTRNRPYCLTQAASSGSDTKGEDFSQLVFSPQAHLCGFQDSQQQNVEKVEIQNSALLTNFRANSFLYC